MAEWEAYDRLDPMGDWREDYRLAFLCSLMMNIAIKQGGQKGAKLTEPLDFMLVWDEEKKQGSTEQSPEEILAIFTAMASNMKTKPKNKTNLIRVVCVNP